MKKLTSIGVILTCLWVLFFAVLLFEHLSNLQLKTLTLNEWGDFLAGSFAPLAFIWLVIGYYQQGEELRLNTEALKTQQIELQKQVEETALLAKNAERQALAAESSYQLNQEALHRQFTQQRMEAHPVLQLNNYTEDRLKSKFDLINRGGIITDISIENFGPYNIIFPRLKQWNHNDKLNIVVERIDNNAFQFPIKFILIYSDIYNEEHKRTVNISQTGNIQFMD